MTRIGRLIIQEGKEAIIHEMIITREDRIINTGTIITTKIEGQMFQLVLYLMNNPLRQ